MTSRGTWLGSSPQVLSAERRLTELAMVVVALPSMRPMARGWKMSQGSRP